MKRVDRIDYAESLAKAQRLDNGFLRCEGKISRVGIQEYANEDGSVHRELRLPEDVFEAASMASFAMLPVTNSHPPGLLTAMDARQFQIGSVGENIRPHEGEWVAAPMMITDQEAIKYINAGRQQLSCGYSCELEEVAGTHPVYGPYDARQTKIRGNHIALVDEARAGADARIRLDDGNVVMRKLAKDAPTQTSESTTMGKITVDGLALELSDANQGTIQQAIDRALEKAKQEGVAKADAAMQRAAAAESKCGTILKNVAKESARRDGMKAKMTPCDACDGSGVVGGEKCDYCDGKGAFRMHDAIKQAPPPDADGDDDGDAMDADELATEQETEAEAKKDAADAARARAGVKARRAMLDAFAERRAKRLVPLFEIAHKHLGADAKLDGLGETAIEKLVLAKLAPEVKLDGMHALVVHGEFRAACRRADAAPQAIDVARAAAAAPAVPAPTQMSAQEAKAANAKRKQDAWKRSA